MNPTILHYSTGCLSDSLTIDGKETADMSAEDLAGLIARLLQEGYLPQVADMQMLLADIIESNGIPEKPIYCEQCGDTIYAYNLKAELPNE